MSRNNSFRRPVDKRRPPGRLTKIGSVIDGSTAEGYLSLAKEMVRVFDVWAEAVGEFNAARTLPESIKNGRLTVWVESPVWIDRFSYFKSQFIDRINEKLGAMLVEELVFKVGKINRDSEQIPEQKKEVVQPDPRPADCPVVAQAVSVIEDADLRAILESFLRRQTDRQKE